VADHPSYGAPEPGAYEELPEPDDPADRPWPRRFLGGLGVALAIAAALVILVRGTWHSSKTAATSSTTHRTAAPAPGPTPLPSPPIGGYGSGAPDSGSGLLGGAATGVLTVTLDPSRGTAALPVRTASDPGVCPRALRCTQSVALPIEVRDAIHQRLPGARIESSTTVVLNSDPWRGEVWFRQLNALVGTAELVLRVQAPGPADRASSGITPDGEISYSSAAVRGYFVSGQVGIGTRAAARSLAALIRDVRLLDPA
jgi:hypothetical protein